LNVQNGKVVCFIYLKPLKVRKSLKECQYVTKNFLANRLTIWMHNFTFIENIKVQKLLIN